MGALRNSRDLFVATSKRQAPTALLLEQLGLASFRQVLCTDTQTGLRRSKVELVRQIVEEHGLEPSLTIMVGDMPSDVHAGHANGLISIAAGYGYGSRESLLAATPNAIAGSTAELRTQLSTLLSRPR